MANKVPTHDGYQPAREKLEKGYQPILETPHKTNPKGGYQPVSSGDNPTNVPSPPKER
ncbi:hypothetical protein [Pseudomonas sp. RIT-PI-q]|uniref:hypothetical protein n=1 Tax=Pseudomonas sp. RIT-PI-q TaxID=1690247 RepID=UPI00137932E6|nr:hypothetical protein [Pseudomonas sp. RIT-PI-q]